MNNQTNRFHFTISGFDYVELYVGNVRYAAHYYRTVWGFEPIAYRGLDTGSRDRTSIALRQGNIVLLFTGATQSTSPIVERLRLHGEGVATFGFLVDDVDAAYRSAIREGATPVTSPEVLRDADGELTRAEVKCFDTFSHAFLDKRRYSGALWPGFRPLRSTAPSDPMFSSLDHVAVCVEAGTLEKWVKFYQRGFGFAPGPREDVATDLSGMNSRVVRSHSGTCKIPLLEPASGKCNSQVAEFLQFHTGPGVQHLALLTGDIRTTVKRLQELGVEFISIPKSYYQSLKPQLDKLSLDSCSLSEGSILVDSDDSGILLQTFTRSIHDRPTMFIEVIERRGALGFGAGNIRALFEAVEREQAMRGGLWS